NCFESPDTCFDDTKPLSIGGENYLPMIQKLVVTHRCGGFDSISMGSCYIVTSPLMMELFLPSELLKLRLQSWIPNTCILILLGYSEFIISRAIESRHGIQQSFTAL